MNKKLLATLGSVATVGLMVLPMAAGAADASFGLNTFNAGGLGRTNLKDTIGSLINVALGFLGILAVLIILWGGFGWMTSGGEQKKVDAAKGRIVQGIIGLVIIMSSWAIASFVISSLVQGTGATGSV
jgi:hypothetical protein